MQYPPKAGISKCNKWDASGFIPMMAWLGLLCIKQKGDNKNMKRKTIVSLIAIAAIVAVVIFAGCIERSFVEYPVTVHLELVPTASEIPGVTKFTMEMTLYKNGTASGYETIYRRPTPLTNYYSMKKWTIKKETPTSIEYAIDGLSITLLSNHDALGKWDIEPYVYTGYWLTG